MKNRYQLSILFVAFFALVFPTRALTQTSGPITPEVATFEPVDATDMVNLTSGDFSYVLPLVSVPSPEGGYPLALSYKAGITMDQEASWVGLGWNLNPGAITRSVNGYPDDWDDKQVRTIIYDAGGVAKSYEVAAGFGPGSKGISVGLAGSWGTHQSFNGSVRLGHITPDGTSASMYVTTAGKSGVSFGAEGVTISMNSDFVGKVGYSLGKGISVSASTDGTYALTSAQKNGSMGISIGSKGAKTSVSAAGGNKMPRPSAPANMSSEITSFWAIPLYYKSFYASFSETVTRYWLYDKQRTFVYGSLHSTKAKDANAIGQQNQSVTMDMYSNPYRRSSFNDPVEDINSNLSFLQYDNYVVSAQGMNGTITPKAFQYGTLLGDGSVLNRHASLINNKFPAKEEIVYNTQGDDLSYPTYFYFNDEHASHLKINPGTFQYQTPSLNKPMDGVSYNGGQLVHETPQHRSFYNEGTKRKGSGKHIEWFTNRDIHDNFSSAQGKGFLECSSSIHNLRTDDEMMDPDGIGGFTITAKDGMTYHYSLPVYQYEELFKKMDKVNPSDSYLEQRKLTPYAYTWLLTAITGPDYIDRGSIGYVDNADWGYWVKFDYGKWSDGYIWRTPYTGEKPDPTDHNFSIKNWGRKQIYYLNAVKTRTHTAYFIKDKREDSQGAEIHKSPLEILEKTDINALTDYDAVECGTNNRWGDEDPVRRDRTYIIDYKHNSSYDVPEPTRLLKLSKIIVVKNDNFALTYQNSLHGRNFESSQTGTIDFTTKYVLNDLLLNHEGDVCTSHHRQFDLYHQDEVLDVEDIAGSGIENRALKIIDLDHDENLCLQTENADRGKLRLKELSIKGKRGADIMPPYEFKYEDPSRTYDLDMVDDWGFATSFDKSSSIQADYFNKDNVAAWSLNKIIAPMGGSIAVDYESDTYYKEAALNTSAKAIRIQSIQDDNLTVPQGHFSKELFLKEVANINLSDWFTPGVSYQVGGIPGSPQVLLMAINSTSISVAVPIDIATGPSFGSIISREGTPNGGGLRVASITIDDNAGNEYTTKYLYNNPTTGKTSGITSYAPRKVPAFIPYVYEIPGPSVMYEYVTVVDQSKNGRTKGSTRYHFDVLQPTTNPDDFEFEMGDHFAVEDVQSSVLLGTHVTGQGLDDDDSNPFTSTIDKVRGRSSVIKNNLATLGRPLSVEVFDGNNMLVQKNTTEYFPKDQLQTGVLQETNSAYKEHIKWGDPEHTNRVSTWYLTSSSRVSYPNVVKSKTAFANGLETKTENLTFDFNTGNVLEQKLTNSWGEDYLALSVPAYHMYDEMGSKTYDVTNKNMLDQKTGDYLFEDRFAASDHVLDVYGVNISATTEPNIYLVNMHRELPPNYGVDYGPWITIAGYPGVNIVEVLADRKKFKVFSYQNIDGNNGHLTFYLRPLVAASVQTWDDRWIYRDYGTSYTDNSQVDVWRADDTYTYRALPDQDGTMDPQNFTDFDWLNKSNGDEEGWHRLSETTRYDHYSMPLEGKEASGNYFSTKMDPDQEFVIASVNNSKYVEFASSGAEYQVNSRYLEGEVEISDQWTAQRIQASSVGLTAHTGDYMLRMAPGRSGFFYKGWIADYQFPKGKSYHASAWVHETSLSGIPTTDWPCLEIKLLGGPNGGADIHTAYPDEDQKFGEWYLLSLDVMIPANTERTQLHSRVVNNNTTNAPIYVDDFRIHPTTARVTTYVYDTQSGELTHTLNKDNLYTRFEYDAAGRLVATYKETLDGEKKARDFNYHFLNQ